MPFPQRLRPRVGRDAERQVRRRADVAAAAVLGKAALDTDAAAVAAGIDAAAVAAELEIVVAAAAVAAEIAVAAAAGVGVGDCAGRLARRPGLAHRAWAPDSG